MDLSVITVTWNAGKEIAEQICSVFLSCRKISFEQIIVDNGSGDDTVNIVETQNFASLRVIKNTNNIGFAAANNQGLKIAQGDFLLFLNPDMRVQNVKSDLTSDHVSEEGSLDKIVEWMKQHQDVGIASCKLVDQNDNFNLEAGPRRFPQVWEMVALILKLPHFFPSILNKYLMKDFNSEKEQEVDSVRGSFMLVRRELIEKLGFAFDPRYYIWFEDVDLCREAKHLGYKVMYTPIISCVDYVGQSFKKRDTYWKQKNFTASMMKYFRKWEPGYSWLSIMLARRVGLLLVWLGELVRKILNIRY